GAGAHRDLHSFPTRRSSDLLAHAPVDARWCLIHATHAEPAEYEAVARRGAVAGLCPITEANLGDGIFPAAGFLAAGGRFGVGSRSEEHTSELQSRENLVCRL